MEPPLAGDCSWFRGLCPRGGAMCVCGDSETPNVGGEGIGGSLIRSEHELDHCLQAMRTAICLVDVAPESDHVLNPGVHGLER